MTYCITVSKQIILRENGGVKIESEPNDDSVFPLFKVTLVTRCALNVKVKEEDGEQQNNIFHNHCHTKDKLCSMIIDGKICTNVTNTILVEKLNLFTTKYLRPYKL